MKKYQQFISILLLSLVSLSATTQTDSNLLPEANPDFQFDYTEIQPVTFASFEAAAAWADVVAVAQLINVDYEKTREINSKGQAFLDVLVPYKGVKKNELLIVNSKGFEEHACYFPDREGEGQRFLVLLKNAANEGEYHGFKPYCQMQVLLTDTGEYALRYPLDIDFKIEAELVKNLNYNDPYSQIDATSWTGIRRNEHIEKYQSVLSVEEDLFQKYFYLSYTQGIMMHEIRKLMNIPVQARISSKQK